MEARELVPRVVGVACVWIAVFKLTELSLGRLNDLWMSDGAFASICALEFVVGTVMILSRDPLRAHRVGIVYLIGATLCGAALEAFVVSAGNCGCLGSLTEAVGAGKYRLAGIAILALSISELALRSRATRNLAPGV